MSDTVLGWLFGGWLFGRSPDDARDGRDRTRQPNESLSRSLEDRETVDREASTRVGSKKTGRAIDDGRDGRIASHLRAHDPAALRTLMEAYFDDLVGIAYTYVGTPDVAQDLVQEVFIRVWDRRDTFDATINFGGYLHRAVRNAALNVLKHNAVQNRAERRIRHAWPDEARVVENEGPEAIDRDVFRRRVRGILDGLPPRMREVAVLHYERGLEPGEIAVMLDVAPRTVYNQLRSAMQALISAFHTWRAEAGRGRDPSSDSSGRSA